MNGNYLRDPRKAIELHGRDYPGLIIEQAGKTSLTATWKSVAWLRDSLS